MTNSDALNGMIKQLILQVLGDILLKAESDGINY